MFRNISLDEEMAEADAVATDIESNDAGTLYAYSFPSIMRRDGRFPVKVGLTTTGDAKARVSQQCRQTCCFEYPVILMTWEVQRVAAVEAAIHSTLEARGVYAAFTPEVEDSLVRGFDSNWLDLDVPGAIEGLLTP